MDYFLYLSRGSGRGGHLRDPPSNNDKVLYLCEIFQGTLINRNSFCSCWLRDQHPHRSLPPKKEEDLMKADS